MRTAVAGIAAVGLAAIAATQQAPRDERWASLARESLATISGTLAVPGLRDDVEVIRDRWGVPHIYAKNTDDLFMAQGYVMAQDRLWQMEMWRREREGRLAEILGPSAVGRDRTARLLILSQVVLSLQLPFAVIPLVTMTASKTKMGALVAPRWLTAFAALIAAVIVVLNVKLVADFVIGG